MYSDGLLKLPIFTIQKDFKILLTVYSLSPHAAAADKNNRYPLYVIPFPGYYRLSL